MNRSVDTTAARAPIVCFANDWDGDPLSKTHLMRIAARRRTVLWVNSLGNRAPRVSRRDLARIGRKLRDALTRSLRTVAPSLHVLSPLALPPSPHPALQALNGRLVAWQVRAAMRQLEIEQPVLLSYLPAVAPVLPHLEGRRRVYHCVDDFGAFAGAGDNIIRMEQSLVAQSDLVVCSSQPLVDRLAQAHPRVVLLQHGVDHAHFARATSPATPVHERLRGLPRPVLGFVGLVAEWVDVTLLEQLARHYAHGTLVIVGRSDIDVTALAARPNVVLTGRLPYEQLPSLLKCFDVALCPFREDALSRAASPLKVREYLAAGLPVVSSPMPEVERLGLCRVARGLRGFVEEIDAALAEDGGLSSDRSATMRHQSWESRWEELERLIDVTLSRPTMERVG